MEFGVVVFKQVHSYKNLQDSDVRLRLLSFSYFNIEFNILYLILKEFFRYVWSYLRFRNNDRDLLWFVITATFTSLFLILQLDICLLEIFKIIVNILLY